MITIGALDIWAVVSDMSAEGTSLVLPSVCLDEKNNSTKVLSSAVFKGDKMIGSLNGIETRSLKFLLDKVQGGVIVAKNVDNTGTNVGLKIIKSKSDISPVKLDDKIVMMNKIKVEVAISEIMGTDDFIDKKNRKLLEEHTEAMVKQDLLDIINKAQKKLNADIFGYGSIIERKMPKEWKILEKEWSDVFSSLATEVEVEIVISRSGLESKPLKKGSM